MGRTPVFTIAGIALTAALMGCQQTGTTRQPFQPINFGMKQKAPAGVAQGGAVQPMNQAYNPKSQQQGVFGQQQPNHPGGLGQQVNPTNSANVNTTGGLIRQEHFTTPHHPAGASGGVIPTSAQGLVPGTMVQPAVLPEAGPTFGPMHPQPIAPPVNPFQQPGSTPGPIPSSLNNGPVLEIDPSRLVPVAQTGGTPFVPVPQTGSMGEITLPPAPPIPVQNTHYGPVGGPELPPLPPDLPTSPLMQQHGS